MASYASIEVSGGIRKIWRSPVSETATSLEKRSLLPSHLFSSLTKAPIA
ncbi:hypothetical protein [Nostoc sp.]